MIQKTVGKFIDGANAISDKRLRALLLASALLIIFMIIHFTRLFLPGALSAGDAQQD